LNARFRAKDAPTNVLSWPAEALTPAQDGAAPPAPASPAAPGEEAESLGDLALGWGIVAREAAAADLSPRDHVFHLIVHGTLHLLGYDHERDGDAARMEALESRICLAEGLRDPYLAGTDDAPRPHAAAGSERSHGR
ncbi:MAG: rRNA maturation RNase YbeY, partial [Pseudomonadota bacterium]